jgi:hypothetical protein
MNAYAAYYNAARTHLSLDKDSPIGRSSGSAASLRSQWLAGWITNTLESDFQ